MKRRYVKNAFNTKISAMAFLCSVWSRSTLSPLFSQKVAFPEWPRKILKGPCANLAPSATVCVLSAAPSLASTSGTFSSVWASCFPGSTTYYFCCAQNDKKGNEKLHFQWQKKWNSVKLRLKAKKVILYLLWRATNLQRLSLQGRERSGKEWHPLLKPICHIRQDSSMFEVYDTDI